MNSNRLLIVSNRLPVSARITEHGLHIAPSSGGLATGLRGWHQHTSALWIGWPGDVTGATGAQLEELERSLFEQRIVPVRLSTRIPVGQSLMGILLDARRTQTVRLLLDYDGTLVPLARSA